MLSVERTRACGRAGRHERTRKLMRRRRRRCCTEFQLIKATASRRENFAPEHRVTYALTLTKESAAEKQRKKRRRRGEKVVNNRVMIEPYTRTHTSVSINNGEYEKRLIDMTRLTRAFFAETIADKWSTSQTINTYSGENKGKACLCPRHRRCRSS